jgi:hypothetical protein
VREPVLDWLIARRPARDAFMDFTCTFDAILQFRAQWRQKLRDRKDSSPLQVCDYSHTEAYLLSN